MSFRVSLLFLTMTVVIVCSQKRRPAKEQWNYRDGCKWMSFCLIKHTLVDLMYADMLLGFHNFWFRWIWKIMLDNITVVAIDKNANDIVFLVLSWEGKHARSWKSDSSAWWLEVWHPEPSKRTPAERPSGLAAWLLQVHFHEVQSNSQIQAFFLSTDRKQQEHNVVILVSAAMSKCGLCSFQSRTFNYAGNCAKYFMYLMGNFLAPYGLDSNHLHIPQSSLPTSDCAIPCCSHISFSL